jgi:hypothetical protein
MSGDTNDVKKAREIRAKKGREILWFRQGGKEYVVDDPKLLDEARALLPHNEKLMAEMEALGRQQEQFGKQQEEVKVVAPDIDDAELRKVVKRLAELKAASARISQEELSEMQSRLGELQAKLGELQSIAGGAQAELGGKQAVLGGKQALLGEQMAREAEKSAVRLNARIDKWIAEGKAERIP